MRFTRIGLRNQAQAVAGIKAPLLPTKNSQREPAAMHGRCNSSGANSLAASSAGHDDDAEKRQSPRKNEGRVIVCHRETLGVLVGATGFEPATSTSRKRAESRGKTAFFSEGDAILYHYRTISIYFTSVHFLSRKNGIAEDRFVLNRYDFNRDLRFANRWPMF